MDTLKVLSIDFTYRARRKDEEIETQNNNFKEKLKKVNETLLCATFTFVSSLLPRLYRKCSSIVPRESGN